MSVSARGSVRGCRSQARATGQRHPTGPRPAARGCYEALRVALVSTERGWHGGEEQAYVLARGIRDRGHTCFILARRGGPFARRTAADGFPGATFHRSGRSPLAILQARGHLARIRPDVLHMNDSHALTCAGLAALGLGIPARIVSRRVAFPVHSVMRYRYLCDQVLCVSGAVARVCRESGIPERQIHLVHDGADPQRVAAGDRRRGRCMLGLSEDQPLLLCVASLTDPKGHKYLLEAMPAVVRQYPRACLALAGDGDLQPALKQQARRLGIADRVRFLGYRRDVPDLIMACDLFILPSHAEGLCTSLIDAMLAGRPIVTTSAGGIPDLVGPDSEEGPVAWIVPPRDAGKLAEAVLEAWASPSRRRELQQRARRRAEQRFTAARMVDETLAAYRKVLEGATSRSAR